MAVINHKFVTELTKIISVMLIPLMGVWSNPFDRAVSDLSVFSPAGIDPSAIPTFSYNPPDRGGPKITQGTGTRI